jgi:hypothetical protein
LGMRAGADGGGSMIGLYDPLADVEPWFVVQGHPRMSTPARKRLMRDFKRLMQDPPAGISGAPQDSNILLWNAVIFGYDAELSLSPLFIWTAVWQRLCICWFHLQPWRYSMGWRLVYLTPVMDLLHPFVLLVSFDHGKFIMCWSASRDLSTQLSARAMLLLLAMPG